LSITSQTKASYFTKLMECYYNYALLGERKRKIGTNMEWTRCTKLRSKERTGMRPLGRSRLERGQNIQKSYEGIGSSGTEWNRLT
jgi:hypothetical protein